ncbi:hypothetical protein [Helicobacter cetorum]|uniref:hypothetical protein n=1 Tax=Helicobacter cetorum TaxID=138563 RepID=UPI000CF10A0B|nr:hypothetical protein [Helicobacter cetorum]
MDKQSKNFWPLGILSVLVGGMGIVVALVIFALKNSPKNDMVYFANHNDVDLSFNHMLKAYKQFQKDYRLLVEMSPIDSLAKTPIFPYYSLGTHGNKKTQEKLLADSLELKTNNILYLKLEKQGQNTPLIKTEVYLMPYPSKESPRLLGEFYCDGICEPLSFDLQDDEQKGRYKLLFKLTWQHPEDESLVLEQRAYYR